MTVVDRAFVAEMIRACDSRGLRGWPDGGAAALAEAWLEDFAGLQQADVREGFRRHFKLSAFVPASAEVLELCDGVVEHPVWFQAYLRVRTNPGLKDLGDDPIGDRLRDLVKRFDGVDGFWAELPHLPAWRKKAPAYFGGVE